MKSKIYLFGFLKIYLRSYQVESKFLFKTAKRYRPISVVDLKVAEKETDTNANIVIADLDVARRGKE